jgi:hypothetical protein
VRARRRRRGSGAGWGRSVALVATWLVMLLVALSVVIWRQTEGVERERALRELETERAVAEADRLAAVRRVEELRSRTRVVRVARERLGMHLPEDREIVFLPSPATAGWEGPLE